MAKKEEVYQSMTHNFNVLKIKRRDTSPFSVFHLKLGHYGNLNTTKCIQRNIKQSRIAKN